MFPFIPFDLFEPKIEGSYKGAVDMSSPQGKYTWYGKLCVALDVYFTICWNYRCSKKLDAKVKALLADSSLKRSADYFCLRLGDTKIWMANFPYAAGTIGTSFLYKNQRVSKSTLIKLKILYNDLWYESSEGQQKPAKTWIVAPDKCTSSEHFIPLRLNRPNGDYEHVCPKCGHLTKFNVTDNTLTKLPS
jgi:hypothetical protein